MARPLFQDIVPPEKRSIKKISKPDKYAFLEEAAVPVTRRVTPPPPPPRPRPEPIQQQPVPRAPKKYEYLDRNEEVEEEIPADIPPRRRAGPSRKPPVRRSRIILTLIAVLIIFGVAFWFISRVSGAWITITPKNEMVSVNSTFNAKKDATDPLEFQTVTIAKDGKLAIAATGEEYANTKASGTIVIYNNTNSAQKLIANTRFATSKGLIFRISQPVTVPAKSASAPGSVEAIVTADATGPDYNVGLTDFTIPGFKDDPKYTLIYGRSKIAIGGGFSGNRKKVSDADMTTSRNKVRDELKAALVREAQKSIPTGFVLPTNSYFIEYESLPVINTDTGIQVNERATFHGFIFKRTSLARAISAKLTGDDNNSADLTGIDSLNFSLKASTSTTPWTNSAISFSLNGTTTLVSVIDADKLKAELAGKPRKSLNAILTAYPTITKAEVTMRPFWKSSFPTNLAEIYITVDGRP